MSRLSKESQALVDKLLDGDTAERQEVLAILPTLSDKESVAAFLAEHLPKERDDWARAWSISALAAINAPGTVDDVAAHLDPDTEEFEWARYWSAIGLAKMQPPGLQDHLVQAVDDPHTLVRAIALRLLIENEFENGYVGQLSAMAFKSPGWYARWVACKVIRRDAGHQPFRERVEKEFVPVLVDRLRDDHESMDVRYQAALALGDMEYKWREAVEALSGALKKDRSDWVRRSCVDALTQIGKPETRDALLSALQDRDAEIRVRAANALKGTLGASGAVSFIVEEALRQDEPPAEHFDALRQIDSKEAANVLADHLLHPDPKMATRASHALTKLGGEEAVRTLQAQRTKALDTYTELLGNADEQVMTQFNRLMAQAQLGFLMSMGMHGVIFGIGVAVLVVSLRVALSQGFQTFERYVGVGGGDRESRHPPSAVLQRSAEEHP